MNAPEWINSYVYGLASKDMGLSRYGKSLSFDGLGDDVSKCRRSNPPAVVVEFTT